MTTKYYEKNETLLNSMALRADHGFGMYDKEEQDKMIEKMSELYDLYVSGVSDEAISEKTGVYIVTVKQVREETNGEGFYKPDEESKKFYQQFRKM